MMPVTLVTLLVDVPVIKVNTALMLGRWKRLYGKRKVISYKRRNFKEAYVEFLNKSFAQMKSEGALQQLRDLKSERMQKKRSL